MHRVKVGVIALVCCLTAFPNQSEQVQAQTKQSSVDLSGQWLEKSPPFYSSIPRLTGCHNGSLGANKIPSQSLKVTIIQKQDGSISIPPFRAWEDVRTKQQGVFVPTNAKVSGNVFTFKETGGGFTEQFKGAISKDGNTITGRVLCQHSSGKATASGFFSLVRLPAPATNTQPPVSARD